MLTLNEKTFLSTTLQQNEEIKKEFDVSWNSVDKVDITPKQYKFILALNIQGNNDKLREVLNNLGFNPPKKK